MKDNSQQRSMVSIPLIGLLAICANTAWAQNESGLIKVRDRNGRETSLFEKVVVTSGQATISDTPEGQGEPLEPWAIFFHIRNTNGGTANVNGKVRVGDQRGNPLGWIEERHLRRWNTRFILDPIEPQPDRAFELEFADGGSAKQNATPEGKKRYALIIEPPVEEIGDDTEYPVVVYAGNVQETGKEGTLAQQRNEISDVKLEIMFVIESSDFMFIPSKDGGTPLMEIVKDSIRELVDEIRRDKGIRSAVRLGFCEYKDSVPKAQFVSRLTSDLTSDFDKFSKDLDKMQPSKLEDDFPDDVLAGLYEAGTNATWSENSVKHVILLGTASCQLSARGQNPPMTGRAGTIYEQIVDLAGISEGYNSTGMSISQLIARFRPQGGGSRARDTKMFHAIQFGEDIYSRFSPDKREELRKAVSELDKIVSDLTLQDIGVVIEQDPSILNVIILLINLKAHEHHRPLALAQYAEVARNNGETDGIFAAVEPDPGKQKEVVARLSSKISDTFKILESVREGRGMPAQAAQRNELAQPLYTLVGAAAEKFKDSEVLQGTATVRDRSGREVAFKKVMVSEDELRRLRSTLDALYTKFQGKTSRADRQDVGSILQTMKEVVAETSAGQELTASSNLKELISDLPLKTAALDTSPSDLALMTTQAFTEWLERLQAAVKRIDDLLENQGEWLVLSEAAVNDKFTFLRLSELP